MSKESYNQFIYENNKHGESMYDVFSRLTKDRIVFLSGVVDEDSASVICATMLFLDSQSIKPISLYINSPGGEINSGFFAIYDTMNYINSPVHTVCIGRSYSAGAVLATAGEKGNRVSLPNTDFMIHESQVATGIDSLSEYIRMGKVFSTYNDKIIKILADNTGKNEKTIAEFIKRDEFMTADEAVKFGLIDKIVRKAPKTSTRGKK